MVLRTGRLGPFRTAVTDMLAAAAGVMRAASCTAITIPDTVSLPWAHAEFDGHGQPRDPETVNAAAKVLLDQLAWWVHLLRDDRAARLYGT